MKLLLSTLCLVLCLSLATCYTISWGHRNPSDYLLFNLHIVREAKADGSWSEEVDYPQGGLYHYKTISSISVIDHFTNTSGAVASLTSGGPGHKYASINIRSQNGEGIDSTVEIWG